MRVVIILMFSVVGIAGSYGVAWFGISREHVRELADSLCQPGGKPYPIYSDSAEAGMSIGMMLIQRQSCLIHAVHPAVHSG